MRHRVFGKKLGRDRDQRKALFKNLVTSLVLHEQIKTTEAKAKTIRGLVDKLITKGKTGSLHARRALAGFFTNQKAATKVIQVLAPRFRERSGGFTRIIRLQRRRGDDAPLVRMELVDKVVKEREKKPKKKKEKEEEKKKPEVPTKEVETKKISPKRRFIPTFPSLIKRPPKKTE